MGDMSYKAAGVDLDAAQTFKKQLASVINPTHGKNVLSGVGGFGATFKLPNYETPVLVSSTDGVGTKLRLAILLDNYGTIGEDLVNACVNDILVSGADPLFFLDYIAVGSLQDKILVPLIEGIARACEYNSCALIGGETAQMSGMYTGPDFDMAGFVVGAVEQKSLIDGSMISPGDTIIGIPSNGLHTNGYSLVRKILTIDENPDILFQYDPLLKATYGETLMIPHPTYFRSIASVRHLVKGMAHITGGGLTENVPRAIPSGLAAIIDYSNWETPPIFSLLQDKGKVTAEEMLRVFNMGIGMVIVCATENAKQIISSIKNSVIIGSIIDQEHTTSQQVIIENFPQQGRI